MPLTGPGDPWIGSSGPSLSRGIADTSTRQVRLLEEDPGLGAGLDPESFEQARRFAVAEVVELPRGSHNPSRIGRSDMLGLLVLDGLMIRGVEVAGRRCGELVASGSLLRPWDSFAQAAPMPFEIDWRVIRSVRLALLDDRLTPVCARWPPLVHELMGRAVERSHTLALMVAIHSLQHVELRLLVLLWHLADRFGRVTPEGTVLPLKLSHRDLAELTGSQRPSVSANLVRLSRQGMVSRRSDRTWLLHGQPPSHLEDRRPRLPAH